MITAARRANDDLGAAGPQRMGSGMRLADSVGTLACKNGGHLLVLPE